MLCTFHFDGAPPHNLIQSYFPSLSSTPITGAAGLAARDAAEHYTAVAGTTAAASLAAAAAAAAAAGGGGGAAHSAPAARSTLYGEQLNPTLDPVKLAAAMKRYDADVAAVDAAAAAAASSASGTAAAVEDDDDGSTKWGNRAAAAAAAAAASGVGGKRKGPYNGLSGSDVNMSAEDVEAYALKRVRRDDPMAALLASAGGGEDGLLPVEASRNAAASDRR